VKGILALVILGVPAATAIAFVDRAEKRRGEDPATLTTTTPIAPGSYTDADARPATIVIEWNRGEQGMFVGGAGTVTEVHVTTGTVVTQGSMLVSVDGGAVFAMASAMPLYRDLTLGDEGADVTALEGFLATFGLVKADGRTRLDRDLAQAIKGFNAFTGHRNLGAVFARSTVVWIGAPDAAVTASPIGSVFVDVGDLLAGPTALYEASPTINGAHGVFETAERPEMGGERIADLDVTPAVTVELAAGSFAIDAQGLAQLEQVGQVPDFGDLDRATTELTASTRLAEPVAFRVLPVTAVVTSRTGSNCVYPPDGAPVRIEITGSEPGLVLVATESDLPPLVLAPPLGVVGCGD
jgi:hypothetical protein